MNLFAFVCVLLAAVFLGPALTHPGFNGASLFCVVLASLGITVQVTDLLRKAKS